MASEPLFDLAEIDLTTVMVPPDEIAQLNPQAGPMRQLDHVIWTRNNWYHTLGVKHVRDDEFWTPHHIPGRPLLPGVLMIEAGAQLASVVYRKKIAERRFLGFTRCDNAIFRGQVVPGDTLYLLAQEVKISERRLIADTQGIVNGQVVYEARITGMVV